jgi:hypothetical protein
VVLPSRSGAPAIRANDTSGWTSTTCRPAVGTHASTSKIFVLRLNAWMEIPSPVSCWLTRTAAA